MMITFISAIVVPSHGLKDDAKQERYKLRHMEKRRLDMDTEYGHTRIKVKVINT